MVVFIRSRFTGFGFLTTAAFAGVLAFGTSAVPAEQSLAGVAAKEKKRRAENRRRGVDADPYTMVGEADPSRPSPGASAVAPPPGSVNTPLEPRPEEDDPRPEGDAKPTRTDGVVKRTVAPAGLPIDSGGGVRGVLETSEDSSGAECRGAAAGRVHLRGQLARLGTQLASCENPRNETDAEDAVGQEIELQRKLRCESLDASREVLADSLANLERNCADELRTGRREEPKE